MKREKKIHFLIWGCSKQLLCPGAEQWFNFFLCTHLVEYYNEIKEVVLLNQCNIEKQKHELYETFKKLTKIWYEYELNEYSIYVYLLCFILCEINTLLLEFDSANHTVTILLKIFLKN